MENDRDQINQVIPPPVSLISLCLIFLKVGSTAFGGFMALISVVETLIVQKKKLLTHEDMLDGVSLATILPGPIAFNAVAYVGYRLRGKWGALISGLSILFPSFILMLGLSILYFQIGEIPTLNKVFSGFVPAITAIIFSVALRMGTKIINNWQSLAIAIISAILLNFVGGFYISLMIIMGSGLAGYIFFYPSTSHQIENNTSSITIKSDFSRTNLIISLSLLIILLLLYIIPLPFLANDSLAKLFITFSGMSLMLFGGGYVFIPMIQEIIVNGYGWVNQTDFTNGIALGQITPGPILITATFIGYAVKGILGAIVTTIGMFFPPALLIIICTNLLEKIKNSVILQACLKGIRPATIGMIFIAGIVFIQTIEFHWASLIIFILANLAIWKFKIEVVFIIPMAGILGLLLY